MRSLASIAGLVVVVVAGVAHATGGWKFAATLEDGSVLATHSATVTGQPALWLRFSKKGKNTIYLYTADCVSGTIQLLQQNADYFGGAPFTSYPVPGSPGSLVYKRLCKRSGSVK